jgi:hypothetical protein
MTGPRNRGKEWTEDDLLLLSSLVRDKMPLRHMKTILGRTESAILHALRNTMYHHLIDHDPEEVAARYRTSVEALATGIVPTKYKIALPDAASDEEAAPEESNRPTHDLTVWVGFIASLCLGGAFMYLQQLTHGWALLTYASNP